jgi:hypothetical protein
MLLAAKPAKPREYTEMQTKFLDAMSDPDNRGDVRACMDIAGYSKAYRPSALVKELKDELLNMAQTMLAGSAVKTTMSLTGLIDDPINPAARTIIAAADAILDRVGIVKTERVEVEARVHNIALLPTRRKPNEEED